MLLVLAQVTQTAPTVEVNNGSAWWPAVVAAVAVVCAAAIAAHTANRRQGKQLAHDTERQANQHAADVAKQSTELAHAREMHEREILRAVLDDLLVLGVKIRNQAADLTNAADAWRDAVGESEEAIRALRLDCMKRELKVRNRLQDLREFESRLLVLVGADSELVISQKALAIALWNMTSASADANSQPAVPLPAELAQAVDAKWNAVDSEITNLVGLVHAAVGVVPSAFNARAPV